MHKRILAFLPVHSGRVSWSIGKLLRLSGGGTSNVGLPPVPDKRANPCSFMQGLGSQAMAANVRASKVWYLDYFYLSGPCQSACPSQITVHLPHWSWSSLHKAAATLAYRTIDPRHVVFLE